jgi:hypothetical protein
MSLQIQNYHLTAKEKTPNFSIQPEVFQSIIILNESLKFTKNSDFIDICSHEDSIPQKYIYIYNGSFLHEKRLLFTIFLPALERNVSLNFKNQLISKG